MTFFAPKSPFVILRQIGIPQGEDDRRRGVLSELVGRAIAERNDESKGNDDEQRAHGCAQKLSSCQSVALKHHARPLP